MCRDIRTRATRHLQKRVLIGSDTRECLITGNWQRTAHSILSSTALSMLLMADAFSMK